VPYSSRFIKHPYKGNHNSIDKLVDGNLVSIIFVEGEMKSSLVTIENQNFLIPNELQTIFTSDKRVGIY